jgi:hypothetical protein
MNQVGRLFWSKQKPNPKPNRERRSKFLSVGHTMHKGTPTNLGHLAGPVQSIQEREALHPFLNLIVKIISHPQCK